MILDMHGIVAHEQIDGNYYPCMSRLLRGNNRKLVNRNNLSS
jgi:hypothetical protein